MSTSTELAAVIADVTGTTTSTTFSIIKTLRRRNLFSRGKQGPYAGAVMNERDGTNILLSCLMERKRRLDVCSAVRRLREMPLERTLLLEGAIDLVGKTELLTFGAALDHVIGALRQCLVPEFIPLAQLARVISAEIEFDIPCGRITIFDETAAARTVLRYGPGSGTPRAPILRWVSINRTAFERIADALGPVK